MACPVHRKTWSEFCQRCIAEAKSVVGYAVEDGRVEPVGLEDEIEVEFGGKTYDTNKVKELFEIAGKLEAMDYDPY